MTNSASYHIVPIAHRSSVEPGETAKIGIFIAGSGEVESAKLQALHTQNDLIDLDSPGRIQYSVDYREGSDGEPALVMGEEALQEVEIDNWGTMAFLTDGIFLTPDEIDNSGIEMNGGEFQFQPIVGEASHDGYPPLLLELNTKSTAQPGDYEIPFILTYGAEGEPAQSTAAVNIHVQTWVERHRTILEILAVAGTLAILIASIVTAAASI